MPASHSWPSQPTVPRWKTQLLRFLCSANCRVPGGPNLCLPLVGRLAQVFGPLIEIYTSNGKRQRWLRGKLTRYRFQKQLEEKRTSSWRRNLDHGYCSTCTKMYITRDAWSLFTAIPSDGA